MYVVVCVLRVLLWEILNIRAYNIMNSSGYCTGVDSSLAHTKGQVNHIRDRWQQDKRLEVDIKVLSKFNHQSLLSN